MNNIREIINSLSKSEYLSEWILQLKDNEQLFSPELNIKPCIKIADGQYRSSVWEGLTIIKSYCDRKLNNEEVDLFIISLLNKSIEIYKKDQEEDKYKKRNSSYFILDSLFDIIISKAAYFNNVDVSSFVGIYCDCVFSWQFSIIYDVYKNRNNMIEEYDVHRIFSIYQKIIEVGNERNDYDKYLIVPMFIAKNPYQYFNYSIDYIRDNEKRVYDMASFFDYQGSYGFNLKSAIFQWLKLSSQYIDDSILEQIINEFIYSENELQNKAGLCLININFNRLSTLFFKNITSFYSKNSFYADLFSLLKNNSRYIFNEDNEQVLTNALANARFGNTEHGSEILKNHIALLYKENKYEVECKPENADEYTFAINFNKGFYVVDHNPESDKNSILKKLEGKNIDEIILLYKETKDGSMYYNDIVNKAFCEHLKKDENLELFFDSMDSFEPSLINTMIYSFDSEDNVQYEIYYKLITKTLVLMNTYDKYKDCLSSVLFVLKKLSKNIAIDKTAAIVRLIDYNLLTVDEYTDTKNIVTACINEKVFMYLEMLCFVTCNKQYDEEDLKKIIYFFIEKYNFKKTKSILASMYPMLFYIDKSYATSLTDYIFLNESEGHNLSYPLLSLSNIDNKVFLDHISDRQDLILFLSEEYSDGDYERGQIIIFNNLFSFYLQSLYYKDLLYIMIDKLLIEPIQEIMYLFNHWFENKQIEQNEVDNYAIFLNNLLNAIKDKALNKKHIDYIIRNAAKTILLTGDCYPAIWELIIVLFNSFDHYFSDECIDLIKLYQDKQKNYITRIVDSYFKSYVQYHTFDNQIVEVYDLLKGNPSYAEDIRRWKVFLVSKNIDFGAKLI